MASLKEIRKRIASVKNTQKITKAMKMVAAAKLRRAQQAVVASRPYRQGLADILADLSKDASLTDHPLLGRRENPKKQLLLVYSSNKGLCGGFNSNLLRKVTTHLHQARSQFEQVTVDLIGRKARDYCRVRQIKSSEFFESLADSFSFAEAQSMAEAMLAKFASGETDECWIAYNQFRSALSQEISIERILPLSMEVTSAKAEANHVDFIFEPGKLDLVDSLVPQYLATQLYSAHLESLASELGARMTAMESATKNASEMIDKLSLRYNRARQAAITTELMDIVNGANSVS